jgi:hypothetical protein
MRGRGRFAWLRQNPDAAMIIVYFVSRPVWLLAAPAPNWRAVLALAVVGPLIAAFLTLRVRRARFAAYVFLTFEIVRSAIGAEWLRLGTAACVLLYLQLPRMRRVWPTIDPRRVGRFGRASAG